MSQLDDVDERSRSNQRRIEALERAVEKLLRRKKKKVKPTHLCSNGLKRVSTGGECSICGQKFSR